MTSALTLANTLAGASTPTAAQIGSLVQSISQAYSAFTTESANFPSPAAINNSLRMSLYFAMAAQALATKNAPSNSILGRLQISAFHLAEAQTSMQGTSSSGFSRSSAHFTMTAATSVIGSADTRSSASFTGTVAPGGLGAILSDTATPLSVANAATTASMPGTLPYDLANVSVMIAGRAAQVIQVSPSRVDFFVPADAPTGSQEILITSLDGYVSRGSVIVAPVSPGLFSVSNVGTGMGLLMNASTVASPGNFSVVTPENFGNDKRTRLMLLGSGISTGLANTDKTNDINSGGVVLVNLAESVTVEAKTASGQVFNLTVEYAGAQGNAAGLDEVIAVLPASMAGTGNVTLTLVAGSLRSNGINITIQ